MLTKSMFSSCDSFCLPSHPLDMLLKSVCAIQLLIFIDRETLQSFVLGCWMSERWESDHTGVFKQDEVHN